MRLEIAAPPDFDLRTTVWSHGWCFLAPFESSDEGRALATTITLPSDTTTRLTMRQPGGRGSAVRITVGHPGRLGRTDRGSIESAVRRMLRLDADLADFHEICRRAGPPFDRAPETGFGRLLRSASLFEDMVKVLATTNTAWSGTRRMVQAIVDHGEHGAFPSPTEVAELGAKRLRAVGWGYRAAYLAEFAERVASGALDIAGWDSWEGTTADLEREIRRLAGFGPYAAGHVLALLDRYDRIGVDTDFLSFVRRRHFPRARRPPTERRMLAVYERWGRWRFLAYWFEMWSESYAGGELLAAAEIQSAIARSSSPSRPAKK